MDERITELVAVGASVAANCHPCLEQHLAQCEKLEIERGEVVAAVRVGLRVNRGGEQAIAYMHTNSSVRCSSNDGLAGGAKYRAEEVSETRSQSRICKASGRRFPASRGGGSKENVP